MSDAFDEEYWQLVNPLLRNQFLSQPQSLKSYEASSPPCFLNPGLGVSVRCDE